MVSVFNCHKCGKKGHMSKDCRSVHEVAEGGDQNEEQQDNPEEVGDLGGGLFMNSLEGAALAALAAEAASEGEETTRARRRWRRKRGRQRQLFFSSRYVCRRCLGGASAARGTPSRGHAPAGCAGA